MREKTINQPLSYRLNITHLNQASTIRKTPLSYREYLVKNSAVSLNVIGFWRSICLTILHLFQFYRTVNNKKRQL